MDCAIHTHVAAYHASPGYRGDTPGLGVMCRNGDAGQWLISAGVFRNSVGKSSNYGVLGWQPFQIGVVRFGGYVGVIDGYPYKNGSAFPFAAGLISVPLASAVEAHFSLLPPVPGVTPATVGLSLTWKL